MTKRERRYHQQKQHHRVINRFARYFAHANEAFHEYIERTKPRPKYPLGALPERGMAMVGEPLPAYTMNIDASAFMIPPELFAPPKPVQIWAVDKDNGISQISVSQMLQTLEYWAQNKEL